VRPSSFYAGDDGARQITGQLITDVGYDPVPRGWTRPARWRTSAGFPSPP
jgi:hypothetical protein